MDRPNPRDIGSQSTRTTFFLPFLVYALVAPLKNLSALVPEIRSLTKTCVILDPSLMLHGGAMVRRDYFKEGRSR